jgi:peptidyl-prolyl cis-trans isomerase SurA
MRGACKLMVTALLLTICGAGSPLWAQAADPTQAASSGMKPVVLDRVVAIINGDVLLQSDVDEELHFAMLEPVGIPSGTDSLRRAARRLISRTLILQQMKQQQLAGMSVSDSDVEKDMAEARKHLPRCKPYDCATDAGWKAFLAANDLTEQDVTAHWKQRMEILRFIDIRFRTGIRISKQEVADYYQKSIVPGYEHDKATPPPLEKLTSRIQEVLLQQHVNGLLQDWLKSLRDEGSVQILDPAYGQSSGTQDDEDQ